MYSDAVFPYKEVEDTSELSDLKEQYKQYIKALEEGTIDKKINRNER